MVRIAHVVAQIHAIAKTRVHRQIAGVAEVSRGHSSGRAWIDRKRAAGPKDQRARGETAKYKLLHEHHSR